MTPALATCWRAVALAAAAILAPLHARAQGSPDPPRPEKPAWTLELGGRVFVRDTIGRVDAGETFWRHDRAVDQARVFAVLDRARLRIALEVDFADGDAALKDTYLRLRPVDWLRVQAGRFKVPMSFLGLESKWRLPSVERGLLSELELDDRELPFAGGRGEGIALQLRPEMALKPRFTAAAFQNPLSRGLAPIDASEELTQDLYLRAEVEPLADLHLAASFALVGYHEMRGRPETYNHFPIGGIELHVDARHLRAWLEGFAGRSTVYRPDGTRSGVFAAGRALIAPRIRRPIAAIYRLEPYAGGSILEPTDDVDGDRVTEFVAGINVAFTRHWRLQLETAHRIAEGVASPVADSTFFRIQLGAAFADTIEKMK